MSRPTATPRWVNPNATIDEYATADWNQCGVDEADRRMGWELPRGTTDGAGRLLGPYAVASSAAAAAGCCLRVRRTRVQV
jgi:hypothetical protein